MTGTVADATAFPPTMSQQRTGAPVWSSSGGTFAAPFSTGTTQPSPRGSDPMATCAPSGAPYTRTNLSASH